MTNQRWLDQDLLLAGYQELAACLRRDIAWTLYAPGEMVTHLSRGRIANLAEYTLPNLRQRLEMLPDPDLKRIADVYRFQLAA